MNSFREDEQQYRDYGFFLIDKDRKIGHFPYVENAVPPTIAKSLENWQMICDYFYSLPIIEGNYKICDNLRKNLNSETSNIENYLELPIEMSSRGVYVYDSYADYDNEQPFFRVATPSSELKFQDLPQIVQNTLKFLRINEISFVEDSLINEKILANL